MVFSQFDGFLNEEKCGEFSAEVLTDLFEMCGDLE